jgi:hypothetical protein
MVELYLHFPLCLHDIIRNCLIKYTDNFVFTSDMICVLMKFVRRYKNIFPNKRKKVD